MLFADEPSQCVNYVDCKTRQDILGLIPDGQDSLWVTINFGAGDVKALVDSGADMSVVRTSVLEGCEKVIHPSVLRLRHAFQGEEIGHLVTVQCGLVDKAKRHLSTALQMAVTDNLGEECLLCVSDYRELLKLSLVAIPTTKFQRNLNSLCPPPEDQIYTAPCVPCDLIVSTDEASVSLGKGDCKVLPLAYRQEGCLREEVPSGELEEEGADSHAELSTASISTLRANDLGIGLGENLSPVHSGVDAAATMLVSDDITVGVAGDESVNGYKVNYCTRNKVSKNEVSNSIESSSSTFHHLVNMEGLRDVIGAAEICATQRGDLSLQGCFDEVNKKGGSFLLTNETYYLDTEYQTVIKTNVDWCYRAYDGH